ncbi:hypothetical protein SAMN02927924_01347 [Sphingobium faniae]|nr:hypothetical protein SAMN02927924_01347 [Sphingobium faniae]
MIRVYIIAADTPQPIRFAMTTARDQTRPVEALQEVLDIPDLADPQRMRELAVHFHKHFQGQPHD